jgi:hypothetical protein
MELGKGTMRSTMAMVMMSSKLLKKISKKYFGASSGDMSQRQKTALYTFEDP